MLSALLLDVSTTLFNFEKRSILTSTSWFRFDIFGGGPNKSFATKSNGPLTENGGRVGHVFHTSYLDPLGTVSHSRVHVIVHVWPVVLPSNLFVHTSSPGWPANVG